VGIDWAWLAGDGAMTKAPLGGPKTGPNPTDRAKKGRNARCLPRAPQGICLDKAYDSSQTRDLVAEYGLTPHIRTRKEEILAQGLAPRLEGPPLGRRGLSLVAQPQPGDPYPLVQEGREPSGAADARQWPHRFQEGPRREP